MFATIILELQVGRKEVMRGLTETERRSEQLQALTFVGLMADDVALAVLHYPTLSHKDTEVLDRLLSLITPKPTTVKRVVIPRAKSMSDPETLLEQAAALTRHPVTEESAEGEETSLPSLVQPLKQVIQKKASETELLWVRMFADTLAQFTFTLADQLAKERVSNDWIPQPSSFFAA
jgi:hypothetical protein